MVIARNPTNTHDFTRSKIFLLLIVSTLLENESEFSCHLIVIRKSDFYWFSNRFSNFPSSHFTFPFWESFYLLDFSTEFHTIKIE